MRFDEQNDEKKRAEHDVKRERFGFAPPAVRLHHRLSFQLINWFNDAITKEIRLAEPLVWLTCLFLAGIGLYFAASSEPHLSSLITMSMGAGFLLWRWREKGARFYGIAAICALLGGFTIASLHTNWSDPSIVEKKILC